MPTAHPLAYCPTCKVAFPIATRRVGGAFVVQNSTTHCPNGHFARILNAHYQAIESEIGAALEHHGIGARKAIRSLWERLRHAEIAPEQAQAEADGIKSGLGAIFEPENFSDPTRKAILEALIAAFTGSADDEEPVVARSSDRLDIPLVPETMSPPELHPKRKGGNRAFQRSLRHRQRLLMNPRGR
jgi:hypothetical protein